MDADYLVSNFDFTLFYEIFCFISAGAMLVIFAVKGKI